MQLLLFSSKYFKYVSCEFDRLSGLYLSIASCVIRFVTPPPTPLPPLWKPVYFGTALLIGSTAGTTGARPHKSSKGDLVLVGTRSWLERHGVSIPPELEGHASSLEWQGKTVVFVAGGGSAKGILAVADSVRPEAREAVGEMHRWA